MIVALPAVLAVTTPLLFTVATLVLLDFHVTVPVRFVVTLRVVVFFVYRFPDVALSLNSAFTSASIASLRCDRSVR